MRLGGEGRGFSRAVGQAGGLPWRKGCQEETLHIPPCWKCSLGQVPAQGMSLRWCQHSGTIPGSFLSRNSSMSHLPLGLVPAPPGRPQEPRQRAELLLNTSNTAGGTHLTQNPLCPLSQEGAVPSWAPTDVHPHQAPSHSHHKQSPCIAHSCCASKEYKNPTNKQTNTKL